MHEFLKRLLEERAKTWGLAKALLDKAEGEKRALSAEEETQWAALNGDLEKFATRIAEVGKALEDEKAADEARKALEKLVRPDDKPEPPDPNSETERIRKFCAGELRSLQFDGNAADYAAARSAVLSGVPIEVRDLTKLTAAAGGDTVPVSFVRKLYEHLIENSAIRRTNVTVFTTTSGEDLRVPKTTAHGTATLVAEAGPLLENDPTFAQVVLQAFKYGDLIQVSSELIQDTAVDLLGYLARMAGRALGNISGTHFVTGDGSGKPRGIVTASTLGKTAASATAITADELIDLFFSVIEPYRVLATWLMKDSTMAAVRKLKDTTNQYLWQPGLQTGTPDQILGRPVITDPNVAAIATGNKTVLFGDFSAYAIRDVAALRFERSDEFAFANDLVTFRAIIRTDGDMIDETGAVKHLIQA